MTAAFRRNDDASQYEVLVDGAVAGILTFYEHEGRVVLDLTRVEQAYAGQGLAGVLARGALDDARERGVLVVPMCPFVSGWLAKNPEYSDVVDQELVAQTTGGAVVGGTRLPEWGRRGGGWVVMQGVLIAAMVTAGVLGNAWPGDGRVWRGVAATIVALAGAVLFISGTTGLGSRQLTPFPRPVAGSRLRRHGAYAMVRHPMYGGILLIALGWSLFSSPLALVPLAASAVFLDAKRRREEAWLMGVHPEYPDYRLAVPRALIPWVW